MEFASTHKARLSPSATSATFETRCIFDTPLIDVYVNGVLVNPPTYAVTVTNGELIVTMARALLAVNADGYTGTVKIVQIPNGSVDMKVVGHTITKLIPADQSFVITRNSCKGSLSMAAGGIASQVQVYAFNQPGEVGVLVYSNTGFSLAPVGFTIDAPWKFLRVQTINDGVTISYAE